ncbi:hypothetical protein [Urbifossiella limnaea]|uniref:Uncharacterized protein n=1 Tax=Urbifossiella limnaea TaxID=2528023 RepID=A0A517XXF4_9BACT|nr:hypothetical protein [Urbifossiella limnaea]QDU22209.1 hypothetical protein ETAA1_41860 [Urbifossiella limnaea]
MTPIRPQDLTTFLRRYRLPGGRVRAVRVRYPSAQNATVEFRLVVREAITELGKEPRTVQLRLRLTGVDEFRVQMRPGQARVKINDARISHINGLFWLNLDAFGLDPGEQPKPHDFRASETYAAGRELEWEEIAPGERPA